ncbi:S-layer homology domain-containing protein [Paenibacillus sambharensis]|nr:S-layer homology domain-containing protein [Paenibacillus sambharensis]
MRETSHQLSLQNSQQPKHFRGGEKKVMKKSLSLLVAIAMVFSVFASMASAAELTAQQKFDALKEQGIFEGYPDGTAGLNKEMTRAEFSKVLALVNGLPQEASAANYTDVAKSHWAIGFIGAVTKANLMEGVGLNKFNPNGKVTIEQMAKTVVLSAGLEESSAAVQGTVSAWAKGYVAAAVEAGIIPAQSNYKANATRQLLVEASYVVVNGAVSVQSAVVVDDKNIEVTFTDGTVVKKTLDTALVAGQATKVTVEHNGQSYEVTVTLGALSISKAAQTDAGEITVSFNRALSANEQAGLTYEVKAGLIPYNVSHKWAEDNKSVVLSTNYLPANEYVVTVKGFDPVTVKVEEAKAAKIEIGATSLQKAGTQDLKIDVLNQFGKKMNVTPQVTVVHANTGATLTTTQTNNKTEINLASEEAKNPAVANRAVKVDDLVQVTAVYPSAGLTASKQYKVVAGSAATSIKLGNVAPLEGKTRISANESGLVLPYEMVDQYGAKILFSATTSSVSVADATYFEKDGINFYLSEAGFISSYSVDSNGVFKFNTGTKTGTLMINAINPATSASASLALNVQGSATVKSLQLSAPATQVVAGEIVKIPFVAVDQFDQQLAGKDFAVISATASDAVKKGKVAFTSNVSFEAGYPRINGKGELEFKFTGVAANTTAHIYANLDGAQVGQLQLTVQPASEAVRVVEANVAKYFTVGGESKLDTDTIKYLDNYGRTKSVTKDTYNVVVTDPTVVQYNNGKLVALKEGKTKVTITLVAIEGFKVRANANQAFEFEVTVLKNSDVTNYAIKTVDTVYGGKDAKATHSVTVELVGKYSGQDVAINQASAFALVTSQDQNVLRSEGKVIWGVKAGTSTVSAIGSNGATLATATVTVSEAAPVATTVTFKKSEYTVTNGTSLNLAEEIEVKDQYGKAITVDGLLASSDKAVTVSGKTVTGAERGQATVTFITNNNVSGSTVVVVE